MLKEAIYKVVTRQDLTEEEMARAMEVIMGGEATEAQIGAFITALRMKGETVAEITAAGKPAIFVPFPRAADDHQNVNARALERAGAAVVVEESSLEAAYLVDTISALLGDPVRLRNMAAAAKSLAHPQAVEDIAAMVESLIEGNE